MARPRNADAEQTQRALLAAAVRRFGEQGLDGTSLRQIADDVGVTFATIHHYFGSKADLFDRCLAEGYERLKGLDDELRPAIAAGDGDPESILRGIVRGAFAFARNDLDTTRFLLRATLFEPTAPHRQRIDDAQRLYLEIASHAIAPVVGREPRELRVPLQGLMFLLTRLAITTESELLNLTGDVDSARREIEEYAGDVAVATLLGKDRT